MLVQRKFVLPASFSKRTINLGSQQYSFKDGEMLLVCPEDELEKHEVFLFRNWEVKPCGECDVYEEGTNDVHGDVLNIGTETVEQTDDSKGDVGTNSANNGTAGADGSGQQEGVNTKLLRAIGSLDAKKDAHWIKDGRPSLEAIQQAYGSSDITRADVEALAPGFKRGGSIN